MAPMKKTLAPSITQRDAKGLHFMSTIGGIYDKAGLSEEEAQRVNEASGLGNLISEFIKKHRYANQFTNEETTSDYTYPEGYEILPIDEQIIKLVEIFNLDSTAAAEYIENLPVLPEGAEGWFAIPRRDKIGATYNEAVETALTKLGESREFYNYRNGELDENYLRQHQRSIEMWDKLYSEQSGDIIIVPAQFGLRHRGKSVRRARETFSTNEFGLGAFATCCMLLTHPKRLQKLGELEFDCSGDEYNWDAAGGWSSCPGFGFGDGGVRFGAFRVAYVSQIFGSASAFLLGSVSLET